MPNDAPQNQLTTKGQDLYWDDTFGDDYRYPASHKPSPSEDFLILSCVLVILIGISLVVWALVVPSLPLFFIGLGLLLGISVTLSIVKWVDDHLAIKHRNDQSSTIMPNSQKGPNNLQKSVRTDTLSPDPRSGRMTDSSDDENSDIGGEDDGHESDCDLTLLGSGDDDDSWCDSTAAPDNVSGAPPQSNCRLSPR